MQFQVLYHYAIGMALEDPRILTLPPYPESRHPEPHFPESETPQ